jgi:hypothetical protein
MTVKLVDATISSFGSVFEKFKAETPKNKVNLILFLADNDPSTNLSWCPGKCFFFLFFLEFIFVSGSKNDDPIRNPCERYDLFEFIRLKVFL